LTAIKSTNEGLDFVESNTNKLLFKFTEEQDNDILRLIINHSKVEDNTTQTKINQDLIESVFTDIFSEF
jgi:succinate dehydrogenase flavin-adding protein (antitoxin of CptAB toxin-antitoxin module)